MLLLVVRRFSLNFICKWQCNSIFRSDRIGEFQREGGRALQASLQLLRAARNRHWPQVI